MIRLNRSQERLLRHHAEGEGYLSSLDDLYQWRLINGLVDLHMLRAETLATETRWYLTKLSYAYLDRLDQVRLAKLNMQRCAQDQAPYTTFDEVPRSELSVNAQEVYP